MMIRTLGHMVVGISRRARPLCTGVRGETVWKIAEGFSTVRLWRQEAAAPLASFGRGVPLGLVGETRPLLRTATATATTATTPMGINVAAGPEISPPVYFCPPRAPRRVVGAVEEG